MSTADRRSFTSRRLLDFLGADGSACVAPSDGPPKVQCGSSPCEPGFRCCNVGSALNCMEDPGCPDDKIVWSCEQKTNCLYGQAFCCVTGTATNGSVCASTLENGISRCVFDPAQCANAAQDFATCSSADECTTNKCEPIEVRTNANFSVIVKVCR